MTPDARDAIEVEALRTDRYLDALLAALDRRSLDVPADAALDPDVREAASQLARQLVRVHPSFRFEERLAARLAEVARSMRSATAATPAPAGPLGVPAPLRLRAAGGSDLVDAVDPRDLRPLLVGGALTSAALSLAGAAWVAWRRAHQPPRSAMARAVRAARDARVARRVS